MLEHTCTISRAQDIGTNGRKQMASLAADVACLFLPVGAQTAIDQGFSLGKDYDVFFAPGTDVKVGDKLSRNSKNYLVSYIQDFDTAFAGHMHVLARQEAA